MIRLLSVLALLLPAGAALAQPSVDDAYCQIDDLPASLRQTMIVIDGAIVEPEAVGPSAENRVWRQFVAQFVNAGDSLIRQRIDARERVTVSIANPDGSGLTLLFSGCVPLMRPEEEAELSAKSSMLDVFFGSDSRRKLSDAADRFTRTVAVAMVEGTQRLPQATAATGPVAFRDSALVASLTKSVGYALEDGVPRVLIVTDLSRYTLPEGDPAAARALGRADADVAGINFLRAEVHVFGASGGQSANERHYLDAFFLSSRGQLATLTSTNGALTAVAPPRSVAIYQGVVDYGETRYPVRMRLARDQNDSVVNSWIEMQASLPKFVPFSGIINCASEADCEYIGDNIFAQVWEDDPGPKADLQPWEPFGGMRGFRFDIDGKAITGLINDEQGFVVGNEEGLKFEMQLIENGLF